MALAEGGASLWSENMSACDEAARRKVHDQLLENRKAMNGKEDGDDGNVEARTREVSVGRGSQERGSRNADDGRLAEPRGHGRMMDGHNGDGGNGWQWIACDGIMEQRSRRDPSATTSEDTVQRVDAEAIAGARTAPERPPG